MELAYFATGCFWGAERRFWQLSGVLETSVGYMGGNRPNPSYEQVCAGVTNHAEIVAITFDPNLISYRRLLISFSVFPLKFGKIEMSYLLVMNLRATI